jgi:hypothetical protein
MRVLGCDRLVKARLHKHTDVLCTFNATLANEFIGLTSVILFANKKME